MSLCPGALVEVPAIPVEEVEDPLEGCVGDGDVPVVPLQLVLVKQSTVQEGNFAKESGQFGRALGLRLAETLVE